MSIENSSIIKDEDLLAKGAVLTVTDEERKILMNPAVIARLKKLTLSIRTWDKDDNEDACGFIDACVARRLARPSPVEVEEMVEDDDPRPQVVINDYTQCLKKDNELLPVVPIKEERKMNLVSIDVGENSDRYEFEDGVCDVDKKIPYILTDDRYIQVAAEAVYISNPGVSYANYTPPPEKQDINVLDAYNNSKKKKVTYDDLNTVLTNLEVEYPKYRETCEDYLYHLKDTSQRLARDDVEKYYRDMALRHMLSMLPAKSKVGVLVKEEFEFLRVQSLDRRLVFYPPVSLDVMDLVIVDPYNRAIVDDGVGTGFLKSVFQFDIENRAHVWYGTTHFAYFVNNMQLSAESDDNYYCFPIAPHRPRFCVTNYPMVLNEVPVLFLHDKKYERTVLKRNLTSVMHMMSASAYRNMRLTPVKNAAIRNYWQIRVNGISPVEIYGQLMPLANENPVKMDFRRRLKKYNQDPMRSALVMQVYDELSKGGELMASEEMFYGKGIKKKDLMRMVFKGLLRVVACQKRVYYTLPIDPVRVDYEAPDVLALLVDKDGVYGDSSIAYETLLVCPASSRELVDMYRTNIPVGARARIYTHAARGSAVLSNDLV